MLVSLFLIIAVAGCTTAEQAGESEKGEREAAQKAEEEESVSERPAEEATTTTQAPATSTTTAGAAGEQIAVIETSRGVIKFSFYSEDAPNTVANFIKLAKSGFYDGTKFHRVEPGFVIQGGDPNSKDDDPSNDGLGGPGYAVKAEFNSRKHVEGTVAMARSQDPDSAGSQFYITLAPQPHLDNNYTVFGQVTEGLDVIPKVQKGDAMKVRIETGK